MKHRADAQHPEVNSIILNAEMETKSAMEQPDMIGEVEQASFVNVTTTRMEEGELNVQVKTWMSQGGVSCV